MKILLVFGTRPEAVKMAPLILELARKADRQIQTKVCVTAQHRQMLDSVLQLFAIHPDYDLDIMQENQTLVQITTQAQTRFDQVLATERPDWVIVQGDTTTAMAAALTAFYQRIRVGHVEAGLRTFNKFEPFPEEINRTIIDHLCDLHFAPTASARDNLLHEGIPAQRVLVTGNTVIDALHWVANQPCDLSSLQAMGLNWQALQQRATKLILVTAHRRENLGAPLENICSALRDLAEKYGNAIQIIYPVHLNPQVQTPVQSLLRGIPNLLLLPPLDYLTWVHLMKHSYLVLTDSGGIQEEAPALGKPVLVLRDVTERPEAVDAGSAQIVGTQRAAIVAAVQTLLDDPVAYARMAQVNNPFGDGHAAARILKAILE